MRLLACLALCVVLVGCGDDESSSSQTESTPTEQISMAALAMKDVCPVIEDALPTGFDAPVTAFEQFGEELESLREQSDGEAQNAIELAQPGLDKLIEVLKSGETGLFASEGEEAFLDGMAALSDRCRAAGSSALQ